MKIYEKPMAIINKFEVTDVIAASAANDEVTKSLLAPENQTLVDDSTQGVVFAW